MFVIDVETPLSADNFTAPGANTVVSSGGGHYSALSRQEEQCCQLQSSHWETTVIAGGWVWSQHNKVASLSMISL